MSLGTCKGKRPLSTSGRSKNKLKWSHTFVCLSKVDHSHIPDVNERVKLKLAGLGEKNFAVFAYGSSFSWKSMIPICLHVANCRKR